MSRERELLVRIYRFLESDVENDFGLGSDIRELLTHPEPIKEREVSGKIISTDDVCNWNLTVAALKDYDHVYVNGIRYTEYQPDINTQYLLDQVARLTAENAMLKEKWLSQPEPLTPRQGLAEYKKGYARAELDLKHEPLSEDKLDALAEANITDEGIAGYYLGFRDAEKAHGIGENDE